MITITQLNKLNTVEDLNELEGDLGRLHCEISHRGGGLGFYGGDVADYLGVSEELLPGKVGAGCNYLGGGLRGKIFTSGYGSAVPIKKAAWLDALCRACKRAYENAENEMYLNDETDEDGEQNWEAIGTNASRRAGVVSAY
jgi:hypothetical protein